MAEPVRGVEIFNLRLIRDLVSAGDEVTVPVHSSWADRLKQVEGGNLWIKIVNSGSKSMLNGIAAVWRLRKKKYDVLLLANVANGLIPAVMLIRLFKIAQRCVLIAHRKPSARFMKAQKHIPTKVISVNGIIARQFADAGGFDLSEVYYGITESDKFTPGRPESERDGVMRFCVLGQLDNAWKGADTAVQAFEEMRRSLDRKCELHLASFSDPSSHRGDGVTAYGWMPAGDIPEFLRRMDVMIVPSRDEVVMRETFSQAIVQGMLCGLPVIASNLPVLVEKLDAGGGMIFNNCEELVKHMMDLASSGELRHGIGTAARKTALERYIWDTAIFRQKYLA